MILKIELENQKFLEIEFERKAYLVGNNQQQLWKVFRSLYYYFNKNPKLTTNVYGEDSIEVSADGTKLSVKNNDVYFINNRDSVYNQMIYKKDSLLFNLLNDLNDKLEIDHSIENINNEKLKLEIAAQSLLDGYSNNLKISFQETTYLDLLKNDLLLEYDQGKDSYPLEFMDTDILMDEFINFLEYRLKNNGIPSWLVLYNLDSFISSKYKEKFLENVNQLVDKYNLKVIYIGQNLRSVSLYESELDNIVISAQEFHQLLPYDELLRSVKMHYPNEFSGDRDYFISAIKRITPYVGSLEKVFISGKDLVLLKVVNDILGYETSFNLDCQLLTSTETKFLKD